MSGLLRMIWATCKKQDLVHILVCVVVAVLSLLDGLETESTMGMLCGVYLMYSALENGIGCVVAALASTRPTIQAPFALSRLGVLLSYANGCVLIFFCFSMTVEGSEKLMTNHQKPPSLMLILSQFVLHVVYETSLNPSPYPLSKRLPSKCIVCGMSIVSWLCIEMFSFYKMDICSGLLTAGLCTWSVWTEQQQWSDILLQKSPKALKPSLDKAVKEAMATDGVLEISDQKYWSIRPGEVIGTLRVRTRKGSEIANMLPRVKGPFESLLTSLTVQFESETVSSVRHDLSLLTTSSPRGLGFEAAHVHSHSNNSPSSPDSSAFSHSYQNAKMPTLAGIVAAKNTSEDAVESTDLVMRRLGLKEMRRSLMARESGRERLEGEYNYMESICYFLPARSKLHLTCIRIVDDRLFRNFVITVILVNSLAMCLQDPKIYSQSVREVGRIIDITATVIFGIEAAIKILSRGFVMHEYAYLRDAWNVVDFLVVVISVLELSFDLADLAALRLIRVLRPLRGMRRMESVTVVLNALITSLHTVFDFLIVLGFLMWILAIVGVHLWSGSTHQRCFAFYNENNSAHFLIENDTSRCSTSQDVGRQCSSSNNGVTLSQFCAIDLDLFEVKRLNFDNIGNALLLMFKVITLDEWNHDLEAAQQTSGWISWVFFVCCTVLGAHLFLNLILAVLVSNIRISKTVNLNTTVPMDLKTYSPCSIGLGGVLFTPLVLCFPVILDKRDEMSDDDDDEDEDDDELGAKDALKTNVSKAVLAMQLNSTAKEEPDKMDNEDMPDTEEPSRKGEEAPSEGTEPVAPERHEKGVYVEEEDTEPAWLKKLRYFLKRSVTHPIWWGFMMLVTLLNIGALGVDHYGIADDALRAVRTINIVCAVIFFVEAVVKLFALRAEYFQDTYNISDLVLVVLSTPDIFLDLGGHMFSVFRIVRILRVVRLFNKWSSLKALIDAVLTAFRDVLSIVCIMALFILVGGMLGVQLFRNHSGAIPGFRNSFDGIGNSVVTVFIILTGDEWSEMMVSTMSEHGSASCIFFLMVFIIGNFVILNLVVAVLIESFAMHNPAGAELQNQEEHGAVDVRTDHSDVRSLATDLEALTAQGAETPSRVSPSSARGDDIFTDHSQQLTFVFGKLLPVVKHVLRDPDVSHVINVANIKAKYYLAEHLNQVPSIVRQAAREYVKKDDDATDRSDIWDPGAVLEAVGINLDDVQDLTVTTDEVPQEVTFMYEGEEVSVHLREADLLVVSSYAETPLDHLIIDSSGEVMCGSLSLALPTETIVSCLQSLLWMCHVARVPTNILELSLVDVIVNSRTTVLIKAIEKCQECMYSMLHLHNHIEETKDKPLPESKLIKVSAAIGSVFIPVYQGESEEGPLQAVRNALGLFEGTEVALYKKGSDVPFTVIYDTVDANSKLYVRYEATDEPEVEKISAEIPLLDLDLLCPNFDDLEVSSRECSSSGYSGSKHEYATGDEASSNTPSSSSQENTVLDLQGFMMEEDIPSSNSDTNGDDADTQYRTHVGRSLKNWQRKIQEKKQQGRGTLLTYVLSDRFGARQSISQLRKATKERRKEEFKRANIPVLQGKSLFIFGPLSATRAWVYKFVERKRFKHIVITLIAISCLLNAVDSPGMRRNSVMVELLDRGNLIFTVLFAIEALLKMIAFGALPCADCGDEAYLGNVWNRLDFVVVIVSIVSLIWSGTAVLRAFRSMRAVRLLFLMEEVRITVVALVMALPQMFNILCLSIIVWFAFAVLGVQLLKGTFRGCNDPDIRYEAECIGEYDANVTTAYGEEIQSMPREWRIMSRSFDNVGEAMLTLWEIALGDGWATIMFRGIDSTETGQATDHGGASSWPMVFYFIAFIVVGQFFIINLFIGVLFDQFVTMKEKNQGLHLVTPTQKNWIHSQKVLLGHPLILTPVRPTGHVSKRCHDIVYHKYFDVLVTGFIILNAVAMSTHYHSMKANHEKALGVLNLIFICVFTVEIILKVGATSWKSYFKDTWNRYDFMVTTVSWVGLWVSSHGTFSVMRMLRLGRIVGATKSRGIVLLFQTLYACVPSCINVFVLLLVIFYVFGVFGVAIFGNIARSKYLTEYNNFDNLAYAIVTLYQVATTEGWVTIMEGCTIQPPECSEADGTCGSKWARLYFLLFVIIGSFITLNLFITVLLEHFVETARGLKLTRKLKCFSVFRKRWLMFDSEGARLLHATQCVELLSSLPHPLWKDTALERRSSKKRMAQSTFVLNELAKFHIPINIDKQVQYEDTLRSLVMKVFGITVEEAFDVSSKVAEGLKVRYVRNEFTLQHYYAMHTIQTLYKKVRSERSMKQITATYEEREKILVTKLQQSEDRYHKFLDTVKKYQEKDAASPQKRLLESKKEFPSDYQVPQAVRKAREMRRASEPIFEDTSSEGSAVLLVVEDVPDHRSERKADMEKKEDDLEQTASTAHVEWISNTSVSDATNYPLSLATHPFPPSLHSPIYQAPAQTLSSSSFGMRWSSRTHNSFQPSLPVLRPRPLS